MHAMGIVEGECEVYWKQGGRWAGQLKDITKEATLLQERKNLIVNLLHYLFMAERFRLGNRHTREATYTSQLYDLDVGNPSGNILEVTVQGAVMNPSKPSSRIKSALQVRNSMEAAQYRLKNEIQLSTNSEEFGESTITITRRNKIKRAVIVCRTIAGSMVNMTDMETEESDSTGNPCAELPCFVIAYT
ncbi:unnamed protein product [Prunus armeniaca]|uniref:Uncharacterized protein n=1 Tax=Prunus armeniaca TaxID=36596 RepID=A0A6J5UPA8_PRUAR|nr:unnamed protein product [Prunus armeniaca]